MAGTGFLTIDEFGRQIEKFVSISDKIDDNWRLESARGQLFMSKRFTDMTPFDHNKLLKKDKKHSENIEQCANTDSEDKTKTDIAGQGKALNDEASRNSSELRAGVFDEELTEMEMDDEDESCMPSKDDQGIQQKLLTYEYHVIYSESYNVPVLYFNIFTPDGKLLPLDQVWALTPPSFHSHLHENKWTTLTQQEHPLLGRPYLQLHPCHTSDLMSQIIRQPDSYSQRNYLMSWLSTVGPMVRLKISPQYMVD